MGESNHKPLFQFDPVSASTWKAKLEKDLKGKTFSDLIRTDDDALSILPFYTSEDRHRTAHSIARADNAWLTSEEFEVDGNEAEVNKEILNSLNGGVNVLLLYVYDRVDLTKLLDGVELPIIRINLVVEGDVLKVLSGLKKLMESQGWESEHVQGNVNWDVLENRARTGNWFYSLESDFETLGDVMVEAPAGMKSIAVNVNLFHNAGATPVQELALGLAMINEYVERLPKGAFDTVWANFAVGGQYFHNIAKLRAIRELLAFYNSERKTEFQLQLHTETAVYNKSVFDMYNNMIRNTVETSAAVIGGADEVLTKTHDHLVQSPSSFSRRIARNNQLLLRHESHMHQTSDPAKGSYYVEELTRQMAEKAWDLFLAIEEKGGFISFLESGELVDMIERANAEKREKFDRQEKVLVGVNKFPNTADKALDREWTRPTESKTKDKVVPVRLAGDWEYEMWKKSKQ